jgi:hypothetical protein
MQGPLPADDPNEHAPREDLAVAVFYNELPAVKRLLVAANVNQATAGLGLKRRHGYMPLPPGYAEANCVSLGNYYSPAVAEGGPRGKILADPNGVVYHWYRPIEWGQPGEGIKSATRYEVSEFYFTEYNESCGEAEVVWPVLHLAACYGDESMVEYLLDQGADPKFKDISGRSAADVARLAKRKNRVADALEGKRGNAVEKACADGVGQLKAFGQQVEQQAHNLFGNVLKHSWA